MDKYALKLKPLAITKIFVVVLLMVMGILFASKNNHTVEVDNYAMLGGGAILIGLGTVFCIIKPGVLYFFGLIWLNIGSFGVSTYALMGPQGYFIVTLPGGFVFLDLISIKLTLATVVMGLVVVRIAKHFLWDDRVLVEEYC